MEVRKRKILRNENSQKQMQGNSKTAPSDKPNPKGMRHQREQSISSVYGKAGFDTRRNRVRLKEGQAAKPPSEVRAHGAD